MDYDYDLEYSDDQEIRDSYYYGGYHENSMTLEHLYHTCLKPTVSETFKTISQVLLCCFLYRLSICYFAAQSACRHLTSVLTGFLSLYILFSTTVCYILFLIFLSYSLLFVTTYFKFERYRSITLILISLSYLCFCELWFVDLKQWHRIRGPQMIIIMKSISLTFDLGMGKLKSLPNSINFAGYALCPCSSIFGPWISYNQYNLQCNGNWSLKLTGKIALKLFVAFVFLTISTCWCEYFIPGSNWKWISAYRDAFSFRSSHYFISYLSEVTLLISGYQTSVLNSVTKPMFVEFPRSLVNVVVYWNIPMHMWLKEYIFSTSRKYGNFVAVFATYAASSLLHGISFQLSAVLLSLGLYSYVEVMLRKRLSVVFNACILARSCRPDCCHKYKKYHPFVFLCNILLVFLTVLHLVYLGVAFDSSQEEETGYNWQHSLMKWADLNYLSHYVAFLTYVMYFLIK